MSIVNSAAAGAYPIAGYTYILVYQEQTDAAKGTGVAEFLWWAIHDGEAQAELTFDEVTGFDVTRLNATGHKEVRFREIELELFPATEGGLANLTAPLDLPGLTPHEGDKLSHTLKLFGRL